MIYLDEIVFNNYICIIIIETLPIPKLYHIVFDLHLVQMSKFSLDQCLVHPAWYLDCLPHIFNIIPKVPIAGLYSVYLVSHKNHSGPIISAMAVCIYMASAVHCSCIISVLELSIMAQW